MARIKEFRLKRFISLEKINLARLKQNYRFYLFDKSWDFSVRYVKATNQTSCCSGNNEGWLLLRLEALFCSIHLLYEG